jgi:hypothetical protein
MQIDFGPIPEYVLQSGFRFIRPCWLEGRDVYWQGKVGEKFTGDDLVDIWQDIEPPNTTYTRPLPTGKA